MLDRGKTESSFILFLGSRIQTTLLSLKVDPIFYFLEARGTQGGPEGQGDPGPPWLPLASKKENMGSTFKERRVVGQRSLNILGIA